jgi:peptidoglycan/xylan/chitin deacetylase (PgdA/CDA1 family)
MTGLGIYQKVAQARNILGTILKRKLDRHPKVYILVYHRVLPEVGYNPYSTKISEKTFRAHVTYLKSRFPIVALSDVEAQYRAGRLKAPVQVVLTFDDGYKDNYEFAFPILTELGVPATFYLVTDYIDSQEIMWDLELALMSLRQQIPPEIVVSENMSLLRLDEESDQSWLGRLNEALKALHCHARKELLEELRSSGDRGIMAESVDERCMSWQQVLEMHQGGMEFGAHSSSHPSLARISTREAQLEIQNSKHAIENHLGVSCGSFAFPFGSRHDYNEDLIGIVKDAGFSSSVLNIRGFNTCRNSPFQLHRIPATEDLSLRFEIG